MKQGCVVKILLADFYRQAEGLTFVQIFGGSLARTIPLSQNRFAIVDEEDFDELSKLKWYFAGGYAVRKASANGNHIRMHREIAQPPAGMQVDHINGDRLDNRRSNLRICTVQQNSWNYGKPAHNTSGIKGVTFRHGKNPWAANIKINGRAKHIGHFPTAELATAAYNEKAKELFGEFARLNEAP